MEVVNYGMGMHLSIEVGTVQYVVPVRGGRGQKSFKCPHVTLCPVAPLGFCSSIFIEIMRKEVFMTRKYVQWRAMKMC
jgi:hypothetical protein